jgi:AcrR family transcriptional regulator
MTGGNRMERKKEETKLKIVGAAIRLFREQGIDTVTMEQIAEETDIAKGTLYNYFPVKEAIIDEYIQRISMDKNVERIARLETIPDTRSRLTVSLNELIEGVRVQKDIFETYFNYRIGKMISLRQEESAKSGFGLLGSEIIKLGQKSGEIRSDLTLDSLEALFEFVFIKVAQQFYKDPEGFNPSVVIAQYVDLFMDGVKQKGDLG